MVPFALAQGGKVTKAALYGEILDVLRAKDEGHHHKHKQGGYLLKGMLDVLGKLKGVVDDTGALEEEIIGVFKQIHLCGPRMFPSSSNDAVNMCQLFHPYAQLMHSFHE